jgi:hypothetical protein
MIAYAYQGGQLTIDGTLDDGSLDGGAEQGPWYVFDVDQQTWIAGPYSHRAEARLALQAVRRGDKPLTPTASPPKASQSVPLPPEPRGMVYCSGYNGAIKGYFKGIT